MKKEEDGRAPVLFFAHSTDSPFRKNFGAPEVLWKESCNAVKQEFGQLKGVAVVPGYCGKTKEGYTISLGRVGLSLTAAVLESAFNS